MSDWRSRAKVVEPEEPRAPADPGKPKASGWRARSTVVETPPPPPPPSPPQKTDAAEAIGRGMGQGLTFGFMDELTGALETAFPITKTSVGDVIAGQTRGREGTYAQNRDANRKLQEATEAEHKKLFTASEIAAGLLAPGGAVKSLGGVATKGGGAALRAMMAAGARQGAISGLGSSKADLTKGDAGRAAFDMALGGAAGTALAPVGFAAGKAAPTLLRAARTGLEGVAARQAAKVLTNGTGTLANKQALPPEVALEAIKSRGIIPFGTVGGAHERLSARVADAEKVYSALVAALEEKGVKGPVAKKLAEKLAKRGREVAKNTVNRAEPGPWADAAEDILAKTVKDPKTNRFVPRETATLGLSRAEQMKRSAQNMARYGKIEDTPINIQRKGVASVIRQANEDAIDRAALDAGPGSDIAQMASEFVPVKRRLGRLLAAEDAAEHGASAAARRSASGPSNVAMDAVAVAAGAPPPGLVKSIWHNLLKARMPSAVASGAYGASRLANALARGAAASPVRVVAGSGKMIGAAQRRATPELTDEFWEQFVPQSPPPAETEEERRIRELREMLQGRPD